MLLQREGIRRSIYGGKNFEKLTATNFVETAANFVGKFRTDCGEQFLLGLNNWTYTETMERGQYRNTLIRLMEAIENALYTPDASPVPIFTSAASATL